MVHICMITALIKLIVTDFTSFMDKCCMQAEKNIAEVLITYYLIISWHQVNFDQGLLSGLELTK